MNRGRLIAALLIFGAGLAVLAYTAHQGRQKSEGEPPIEAPREQESRLLAQDETPAAQASARSTTRPTARPTVAVRQEQAEDSPETQVATQPTQARERLFVNQASRQEFATIGGLTARLGDTTDQPHYPVRLQLSNRGAAVYTAKLANHFATVDDLQRYKESPASYPAAAAEDPELHGHYSLLNPVGTGETPQLAMATGKIEIFIEDRDKPFSTDLSRVNWQSVDAPPATERNVEHYAYAVTLYRGESAAQATPLLRLVKTYTVQLNDYSVGVDLQVENLTDEPLHIALHQGGPTGLPREEHREDMRQGAYANLEPEENRVQIRIKPYKQIEDAPAGERVWLGRSDDPQPVLWVGVTNKFFGSMMYLRPAVGERLQAPTWGASFYLSSFPENKRNRNWASGVVTSPVEIRPGRTRQIGFDVYIGPKRRAIFTDESNPYHRPLYEQLRYLDTVTSGGCPCSFSWLSLSLMWLLDKLSWLALGNYGIAIIALVLLVRLVLHPLARKQQMSMMKMQKLGPEMQKLKEKYADDKDALQRETMQLYKTQGATPLLGCLPMLLQMPIWIALFTGLRSTVELRHAAFLPVWITDLAAPDSLFTWDTPLPLIGTSFNLLPILLAVAMFLQQKYTPQTSPTAAATPEQAQQQKMMRYMFPGMMLVFFYGMPSGLTLYIMSSTFAGVLDQYYVRKHIRAQEEAQASTTTTVRAPGKAARGHRPKKPKGPFWTKRG